VTGHLIHVGFPKTGSNLLRRWFREHPQLAYADGGIAGYRDVYEVALEAVAPRKHVLYRVTSSESFTTPSRAMGSRHFKHETPVDMIAGQENVRDALMAIFPDAYVLIVTRGFRSMIASSFSQYVRSGATVQFEEFLDQMSVIDAPWDYDRVILMYQQAFGAERVIVMPWELLRDERDAFARGIEQRLGLTHFPVPSGLENPSFSPVELSWYPRMTRIVQRLPLGETLKRLYLRGVFANRFRSVIAVLQRVRPRRLSTSAAVPERIMAALRMKARSLRDNPLYARYAADYYRSESTIGAGA
jgi:hypothetical protein